MPEQVYRQEGKEGKSLIIYSNWSFSTSFEPTQHDMDLLKKRKTGLSTWEKKIKKLYTKDVQLNSTDKNF